MSRKRVQPSIPGGGPLSKKSNSGRFSNAQLMPDAIDWPPLDTLWQTIGDPASERYLKSQPSIEGYEHAVKPFFARLSLIVRGLHQDELMVVFRATLPFWYSSAEKVDKVRVSELFESAHTWVETQLVGKLQSYSKLWYASEAGAKYQQQWLFAKRQKNAPKYPYPHPPATEEEMLRMNDLPGLAWTYASVSDFWSVALAAVEIAETPSGKLGWISDNTYGSWYTALYSVALNLIRQYAIMSVDSPEAEIFRVPLRDLLRAVPTFKGGFDKLTIERKSQVLIADVYRDLSRIDEAVRIYDLDSDAALDPFHESAGSSPPGTPPPNARACAAFVEVANKNEAMYEQAAKEAESVIYKQWAKETVELLQDEEFAPRGFRLDRLSAPELAPEVADAIGLKYGRLSMRAKTKLHTDQMKVELKRLKLLVSQACRRINELEQEVKYIESLEVDRANEARILKALRDQQRDICHQLRDRMDALAKPLVVDDSDEDGMSECAARDQGMVPSVKPAGDKHFAHSGTAANKAGSTKVGSSNGGVANASGSKAVDSGAGNDVRMVIWGRQ